MSENVKLRLLKREEIQTAGNLKTEDIFCPEFGEDAVVRIQELTADSALEIGAKVTKSKEAEEGAMMTWIIASAINEDGSPLFGDSDRPWLGKKGMNFIMRIGRAVLKLNGLDREGDEDRAKN